MASAIRCARAAGDLKYLSGSKSMVSIVMTVSSQALLQSLGPLYVACLFAFRAAGQHEHHGPAPYREIGAIVRAMMNPMLADAISHRRVIAEETAPHPQQPLGTAAAAISSVSPSSHAANSTVRRTSYSMSFLYDRRGWCQGRVHVAANGAKGHINRAGEALSAQLPATPADSLRRGRRRRSRGRSSPPSRPPCALPSWDRTPIGGRRRRPWLPA